MFYTHSVEAVPIGTDDVDFCEISSDDVLSPSFGISYDDPDTNKRFADSLSDPIIQQMLKNYGRDLTDSPESETLRRSSSLLKHSKHYREMQVKKANNLWTPKDLATDEMSEPNDIWRTLVRMDDSSFIEKSESPQKRLRFSDTVEIIGPSSGLETEDRSRRGTKGRAPIYSNKNPVAKFPTSSSYYKNRLKLFNRFSAIYQKYLN